VGGSQRTCEFFSAAFDYSHVSCVLRSGCQKRNPILQSYPRHLLRTGEFWDWAAERGYGLSYESSHRRVRDHFRAWSTGLCALNTVGRDDARLPPSFLLCNANSFGDVFCQVTSLPRFFVLY